MNHCHFYYFFHFTFVTENSFPAISFYRRITLFFWLIFRCNYRTIGTEFDSFTPKCKIQVFFLQHMTEL